MTATPLSGVCRHRTDLGVLCRRTGLGDLAFPERLCQEVHLHAIGLFNDLNAVSHKPVRGLLHLLPHDVVEEEKIILKPSCASSLLDSSITLAVSLWCLLTVFTLDPGGVIAIPGE